MVKTGVIENGCPKAYLELIVSCCQIEARARPSFTQIVERLRAMNLSSPLPRVYTNSKFDVYQTIQHSAGVKTPDFVPQSRIT